jgi:hypothetical protein
MPVFAALAGGKVPLYRPLGAQAGGKELYRPLELLYRPLENILVSTFLFLAKLGKQLKKLNILC